MELYRRLNGIEGDFEKMLESGGLYYIYPLPKTGSSNNKNPYEQLSGKQLDDIKSLIETKNRFAFSKILPQEANFIRIDQIRHLNKELHKTTSSKYRVVVIPDIDRMNNQTANAFLKTLEEPPEKTIIWLTTSKPKHILQTIKSRCKIVNIKPPKLSELTEFIENSKEFVGYNESEKKEAILSSDGSIVKVLSYLNDSDRGLYSRAIQFLRLTLRPHNYQIALIDFIQKEVKTLDKSGMMELVANISKVLSDSMQNSAEIDIEYMIDSDKKTIKAISDKFSNKIDDSIFAFLDKAIEMVEVNVAKDQIAMGIALNVRKSLLSP